MGNYCIGLFLDLRKAFDVCSHKILLGKLGNFGIGGVAKEWFSSYLKNRSQMVDIDGNMSHPVTLGEISVIQGSVLGPTLFNMYINDLSFATSLDTAMFADDTQCLAGGGDLSALIDHVNIELKKLAAWFKANRMAVNADKTHFIIFHTKGKKIDMNGKQIIFDDNESNGPVNPDLITPLTRIHSSHNDKNYRSFKLLGVKLDENLTFQANTEFILSKLNRAIFMINRAKNFLPKRALLTLYHSLFHCHLLYCSTLLGSTTKTNLDKITKLQKKAIRIITNSKFRSHTDPLFEQLRIMKFGAVVERATLCLMHAIYHSHAPSSLMVHWTRGGERNFQYELRNNDDFIIPRCNYSQLANKPLFYFPECWNNFNDNKYIANKYTFTVALDHEFLPPPPDPLAPHPLPVHPLPNPQNPLPPTLPLS
jgi:hypothetical protein